MIEEVICRHEVCVVPHSIKKAPHPDTCKPRKKRLKFDRIADDNFVVYNRRKEMLGEIHWDVDWKRFCWAQDTDVIMTCECMDEVSNFMRMLEAAK